MKTDAVTKAFLGVIALALVVLAGQGALSRVTSVQAASTGTAYEYKLITRDIQVDYQTGFAGGEGTWKEDGNTPPDGANNNGGLGSRVQYLGSQGWELIADVTFSQHMNVDGRRGLAMNGVTTGERLIFRRRR